MKMRMSYLLIGIIFLMAGCKKDTRYGYWQFGQNNYYPGQYGYGRTALLSCTAIDNQSYLTLTSDSAIRVIPGAPFRASAGVMGRPGSSGASGTYYSRSDTTFILESTSDAAYTV